MSPSRASSARDLFGLARKKNQLENRIISIFRKSYFFYFPYLGECSLTKYHYFLFSFQASFHHCSMEVKFSLFPTYSREWERYQDSLREKERAWELELMRLMEASTLTATATIAATTPNNCNEAKAQ